MVETKPIRVIIVDDHPVVRRGLTAFLKGEADIELLGEAKNGLEAVELARTTQPDIVLLDLVMPRMDGLEAIEKIKVVAPQTRILVITSFDDDDKIFPAIKKGAQGYLLKEAPPDMLLQAIREISREQSWLHPAIARKVIEELSQPSPLPPTEAPLTDRELNVLQLVAQGLSNQEIADKLVISEGTVRFHVSHILDKLHLANRTQAALYALRKGISSLDEGNL